MTLKFQSDAILLALKTLLADNIKCEDNKLFISNKFKYDVFNLLVETDEEFREKLFSELDYCEEEWCNIEILLFETYLIRTDDYNYILDKKKKDKKPIILLKLDKNGNEYKDYSNFKTIGYYSDFKSSLRGIRRDMLINDTNDINDLEQLRVFIDEMDKRFEKELAKIRL